MPVRLEGTIKRFIGNSVDEKPTAEVPAGSSFLETNTGIIFRYDGRSWWPGSEQHELTIYFEAILNRLEEIRDVLLELVD